MGEQRDDDAPPFRDAEAWLAERGIEREPISVPVPDGPGDHGPGGAPAGGRRAAQRTGPPPSEADGATSSDRDQSPGRLEDEVDEAVAFVRRSTARSPQSEERLADKLVQRGHPAVVVEQALARCREQGVVDDEALGRALAEEGRRKGHARRRIGRDLRRRGLSPETIDTVLSSLETDDEAVAAELAARRARQLSDEDTETAFRRVVGYLARRGHSPGLARRVARQAILDDGGPSAGS